MYYNKIEPQHSVEDWIQNPIKIFLNSSIILKLLYLSFPLIWNFLLSNIIDGRYIHVGVDPCIGNRGMDTLKKYHLTPLHRITSSICWMFKNPSRESEGLASLLH